MDREASTAVDVDVAIDTIHTNDTHDLHKLYMLFIHYNKPCSNQHYIYFPLQSNLIFVVGNTLTCRGVLLSLSGNRLHCQIRIGHFFLDTYNSGVLKIW